jgi:transposase-like protein
MSKAIVSQIEEQAGSADALTELVREGARRLIAQALEAELEELCQGRRESVPAGRSKSVPLASRQRAPEGAL